jgi:uncharacterized protein YecE (DUF72 family)
MQSQLEPGQKATSDVGYIRLHGQNLESWFREDAGRDERYNYLYSTDELDPWIRRIMAVSEETRETYVIANNHFQGQAPTNALQIKSMISGQKVSVPDDLQNAFPQLREIARALAEPKPEQGTLF